VNSKAISLEISMMRHFPDTKQYLSKARSLLFNLKDKNNNWLRESILSNRLKPDQVVKMDPKDLASEAKKQERADTLKEDLAARRTDWQNEQAKNSSKEGFFKCFKCGSKKTNYYQM
jgi:DNA-directed RNA polymerase subunit M/transcription elongation factor TFIIS